MARWRRRLACDDARLRRGRRRAVDGIQRKHAIAVGHARRCGGVGLAGAHALAADAGAGEWARRAGGGGAAAHRDEREPGLHRVLPREHHVFALGRGGKARDRLGGGHDNWADDVSGVGDAREVVATVEGEDGIAIAGSGGGSSIDLAGSHRPCPDGDAVPRCRRARGSAAPHDDARQILRGRIRPHERDPAGLFGDRPQAPDSGRGPPVGRRLGRRCGRRGRGRRRGRDRRWGRDRRRAASTGRRRGGGGGGGPGVVASAVAAPTPSRAATAHAAATARSPPRNLDLPTSTATFEPEMPISSRLQELENSSSCASIALDINWKHTPVGRDTTVLWSGVRTMCATRVCARA